MAGSRLIDEVITQQHSTGCSDESSQIGTVTSNRNGREVARIVAILAPGLNTSALFNGKVQIGLQ
ncbi:hypothetical protein FQN52_006401 [Onygenales sp. PD_12]|nr:hypothetical protein FQN52_006401 [Onygenales sp. PD_12]